MGRHWRASPGYSRHGIQVHPMARKVNFLFHSTTHFKLCEARLRPHDLLSCEEKRREKRTDSIGS